MRKNAVGVKVMHSLKEMKDGWQRKTEKEPE